MSLKHCFIKLYFVLVRKGSKFFKVNIFILYSLWFNKSVFRSSLYSQACFNMWKFIIMTLYIDDILIAGNNVEYLKDIKSWLSSNFEMKVMGDAVYILGVNISRDCSRRLLSLSQETYINKVLERFNM